MLFVLVVQIKQLYFLSMFSIYLTLLEPGIT